MNRRHTATHGRSALRALAATLAALAISAGTLAAPAAAAPEPRILGTAHVQNIGDQKPAAGNPITLGTSGRSLRVEGMTLKLVDAPAGSHLYYATHVQNVGWQDIAGDGAFAGTKGRSLRLEGFFAYLTGPIAQTHTIQYRAHVQNIGWQPWRTGVASVAAGAPCAVNDGWLAGTQGLGLRMEALEFRLIKKPQGSTAPASLVKIDGLAHVQNIGDQRPAAANPISLGTSGRSLRVEGLGLRLLGAGAGSGIQYRVHAQNVGWQDWRANGTYAGTKGHSYRLEGFFAHLTGPIAGQCRLQYRAHVQNIGWQDWVTGEASTSTFYNQGRLTKYGRSFAGTAGRALRMEALEFRLVQGSPDTAKTLTCQITADKKCTVKYQEYSTTYINMPYKTGSTFQVTLDTLTGKFNAKQST